MTGVDRPNEIDPPMSWGGPHTVRDAVSVGDYSEWLTGSQFFHGVGKAVSDKCRARATPCVVVLVGHHHVFAADVIPF